MEKNKHNRKEIKTKGAKRKQGRRRWSPEETLKSRNGKPGRCKEMEGKKGKCSQTGERRKDDPR